MTDVVNITILGGGPAGLAVGYYAHKAGVPFVLYEASERVGGNCSTRVCGDFRYDSGAHRLHDRDPEITRELKSLLGDGLRRIDLPSQIYDDGRLIRFPLAAAQLFKHLGVARFSRAAFELARARLEGDGNGSFEDFALHRYGATLAERFLFNYSEKLWGAPPAELSAAVAGKRLSGLDLRSFIADSLTRGRATRKDVEGVFYYPRLGIGAIPDRLAQACGEDRIRTNCPVTSVSHHGGRIRAIEVEGRSRVPVDQVVSSLPLPLFLRMLDPPPRPEVLDLTRTIRYRQVRLVVILLDRESVTEAATVYFPDRRFPFTRLYEPRNRCPDMAPPAKTSLVAEIPCYEDDHEWNASDDSLVRVVSDQLLDLGWVRPEEMIGASTDRLYNAYPVLDIHHEATVAAIHSYLDRFQNLRLTGRSGRFVYGWIHDMMRFGLETVADITGE